MMFQLLVGTQSKTFDCQGDAFAEGVKAALANPGKAISVRGDGKVWNYVGEGNGDNPKAPGGRYARRNKAERGAWRVSDL